MSHKIMDKKASYKLYESGEFGNKLRTWGHLSWLFLSTYTGSLTMRYAGGYNKWCEYDVGQEEVKAKLEKWASEGADLSLVRFNESAPDDRLVIQGEFAEDKDYKYILSYSTEKAKMREAMKHPQDLTGEEALNTLMANLSPRSMLNMKRLLSMYPGAVVEFSVYDHCLGDTPRNNTVFWEVRHY